MVAICLLYCILFGIWLTQRQHGPNGVTVAPGLGSSERAGVVMARLIRR